jgi:hypothetical protein
MKKLPYIALLMYAIAFYPFVVKAQTKAIDHITINDAEKMFGEPVKLKEKTFVTEKGIRKYNYTFTAIARDTPATRERNLYCIVKNYPDVASAAKVFLDIRISNKNMPGFNVLNGSGDEGNIQTDGQNFYFMITRKGTMILIMKLNKISGRSSLKVFEEIGRQITLKM